MCGNRQLLVKDESWKLAVIAIHELRESAAPQLCVISHASTFLTNSFFRKKTEGSENYRFLWKLQVFGENFVYRTHPLYCKKQETTAPTKFLNHSTEFSPHPWIKGYCLDVERFRKKYCCRVNYCNGETNFIVTRSVQKWSVEICPNLTVFPELKSITIQKFRWMDEAVTSIVSYTPYTYDLEALWTAADTLIGGTRQFPHSHLKLLCCIVCCIIRQSSIAWFTWRMYRRCNLSVGSAISRN